MWKFQNLEILKERVTREMIPLLNHLVSCLYPLGSKILALNASFMRKINHMKKYV